MRDIEELLRHVMPLAPACPEPVAIEHIRNAAIDFCTRTSLWRETDHIDKADGDLEIICVPPYATLHRIERALFDGQLLEPITYPDAMDMIARQHNNHGDQGRPRYISQAQPDSVRILPRGLGRLDISMVLKPHQDAEQLPDFLVDHHGRTLAAGALSTLLMLVNQPFTNPGLASIQLQIFERDITNQFAMYLRGQQRARLRTKPSYF